MKRYRNKRKSACLTPIITIVFTVIILINIICTLSVTLGLIGNIPKGVLVFLQDTPEENKMTNTERVESTLLGTGLTVISIAIAIWAGLNIANAIERKEINEVSEKIDELNKKSQNISEALRETNIIYKNIFIQELMKINEDEASKFFVVEFERFDIGKKIIKDDIENIYIHLTNIEQLFYEIYHLHEVQSEDKQNIIHKVRFGKASVEEFKKVLNKHSIKEPIIELYLDYRNTVFDFYMGYCVDSVESYQRFLGAAKGFKKCLKGFCVDLPNFDDENFEKFPNYKENKETMRRAIFLSNSIGEAYSKISEQYNKLVNKSCIYSFRITEKDLLTCAEQAIFFCGCACEWAKEDVTKREVYFRNLGCAYERYDRIPKDSQQTGMSFEHKEEILKNYLSAFSIVIDNRKVATERVERVYYVLLSYMERCFRNQILKIGKKFESINTLEKFIEEIKYLELNKQDLELLTQYQIISDTAISDKARFHVYYCLNGFAYTYIILLILAEKQEIIKNYGSNVLIYMDKVKGNIERLHIMLPEKDDYTKDLENWYTQLQKYIRKSGSLQ